MAMKDLSSRSSGIFVNLRYGLYLKFQLNPDPITINKPTNYNDENVPGQSSPFIYWSSGGAKMISFELMFDKTEGGRTTGLFSDSVDTRVGVMDYEAILESFLYPRSPVMEKLGRFNLPSIRDLVSNNVFLSPPDLYFIYGLRWYKCKLMSAPFTETIHNNKLVPMRFTVPIELRVVEDGVLDQISTITRLVLSVAGSVQALAGIAPTVLAKLKGQVAS